MDESLNESNTTVEAITVICRMLKSNKMISDIIFSKRFSSKIMKRVFVMTDKFNMNKMNYENNQLSQEFKQMVCRTDKLSNNKASALLCLPEDVQVYVEWRSLFVA